MVHCSEHIFGSADSTTRISQAFECLRTADFVDEVAVDIEGDSAVRVLIDLACISVGLALSDVRLTICSSKILSYSVRAVTIAAGMTEELKEVEARRERCDRRKMEFA